VGQLWWAPNTGVLERKRIAPCLLEKIVVWSAPEHQRLQADVSCKAGERTQIELARDETGV
jgi:hypothetical protein